MYMQQSIVKCESGLYNRQATYFIQKANEFKSSIWVEVEDRKINAKSLLGVLSMGITKGTEVFVRKVAPLGDPMEVTVRGYELSLRKADTEMIEESGGGCPS